MNVRSLCLSVVLSLLMLSVMAQSDTITVSGVVKDGYTNRPLQGVSIVNSQASVSMATDGSGFFQLHAVSDQPCFLFFPGYHTVKFTPKELAEMKKDTVELNMLPLSTGLSQAVIIRAPKTLEDIEEERRKMGDIPRELEKPQMSFTSPISALYDLLSNRAQEREKLKKQMQADEQRRILRELLYYYNENGLIDLPEDHFDAFINYCGFTVDFLKHSTDYEITTEVVKMYNRYGLDSGLIK